VLAGCGLVGQGGGEPGEQDVEAAFESGGAVVDGQDAGPQRERGGQRPSDDQRHDVRVGQRQRAEAAGGRGGRGEGAFLS
jgi:hypothetical protein